MVRTLAVVDERIGDIARAVEAACVVDATAEEAWEERMTLRRGSVRHVVRMLAKEDRLAPGWSVRSAEDFLFAFVSPATFRTLTFRIEGRLRLDDDIPCGSTRGPYGGTVLRLGFDSLFWPQVALESWLDGCLGEGRAAAFAIAEARAAEEPSLADVQQMIARDETGHAALAWDVMRWALAAGGEQVRAALLAALDTAPPRTSGVRQPDLRSYGVLAEDERREITERHHGRAKTDLVVLLG